MQANGKARVSIATGTNVSVNGTGTDFESVEQILSAAGDVKPPADSDDALKVQPALLLALPRRLRSTHALVPSVLDLALDLCFPPLLPHPYILLALLQSSISA